MKKDNLEKYHNYLNGPVNDNLRGLGLEQGITNYMNLRHYHKHADKKPLLYDREFARMLFSHAEFQKNPANAYAIQFFGPLIQQDVEIGKLVASYGVPDVIPESLRSNPEVMDVAIKANEAANDLSRVTLEQWLAYFKAKEKAASISQPAATIAIDSKQYDGLTQAPDEGKSIGAA